MGNVISLLYSRVAGNSRCCDMSVSGNEVTASIASDYAIVRNRGVQGGGIEDGVRAAHAVQGQDGGLADRGMSVVEGGVGNLQAG